MSLNPQGETYASTGASGNVFIHSAQITNFGEKLSTLSPGRNKFGMFCTHVCLFLKKQKHIFLLILTLFFFLKKIKCHDRVQMVDGSPCPQKADRSTYMTLNQTLYRSHLLLMPCLSVHSHGLQTPVYVFLIVCS